jgi:hypothetical protein
MSACFVRRGYDRTVPKRPSPRTMLTHWDASLRLLPRTAACREALASAQERLSGVVTRLRASLLTVHADVRVLCRVVDKDPRRAKRYRATKGQQALTVVFPVQPSDVYAGEGSLEEDLDGLFDERTVEEDRQHFQNLDLDNAMDSDEEMELHAQLDVSGGSVNCIADPRSRSRPCGYMC